jgi:hypothetical protein
MDEDCSCCRVFLLEDILIALLKDTVLTAIVPCRFLAQSITLLLAEFVAKKTEISGDQNRRESRREEKALSKGRM